jgi:hypothetical protein
MLRTKIVRLQLVMVLTSELAACAASEPGPWQKPGADEPTVAKDTSECRTLAEQEALRRYPYGFSSPSFGAAGVVMSQQRDDTNRTNAEVAAFNSCLRDRGYTRGSSPDR